MASVHTVKQPYTPSTLRRSKRWRPKKWKIEYDEMIIKSLMGVTNLDLSKQYNYTPQHVSTILNSPYALATKNRLLARAREESKETIGDRLSNLREKVVGKLEKFFADDEIFEKIPSAVAGRGLEFLKGLGDLRVADQSSHKTLILDAGTLGVIREGMKKADEARLSSSPKQLTTTSRVIEDSEGNVGS